MVYNILSIYQKSIAKTHVLLYYLYLNWQFFCFLTTIYYRGLQGKAIISSILKLELVFVVLSWINSYIFIFRTRYINVKQSQKETNEKVIQFNVFQHSLYSKRGYLHQSKNDYE